jgi:hypothetical protein
MTGPEHYAEAERLLAEGRPRVIPGYGEVTTTDLNPESVAAAQVHATLALAAATALSDDCGLRGDDYTAWRQVAATNPEAAQ